jgi:hypothetical protein
MAKPQQISVPLDRELRQFIDARTDACAPPQLAKTDMQVLTRVRVLTHLGSGCASQQSSIIA